MSLRIRERPPLRHHVRAISPSGRPYRWGLDEPNPENVISGLRSSSTAPGGHESMDAVLPRRPGVDYSDLKRLSTLQVIGAGGAVRGEFRLERTPRVSGDRMSISPSAVGWQAHLDDDKFVREIYSDLDQSRWQGPSAQRNINVGAGLGLAEPSGQPDETTGTPTVRTSLTGPWTTGATIRQAEAWYSAQGIPLGSLYYAWRRGANLDHANTNWSWKARLSSDDVATSVDATTELRAAGPGSGTLAATAADRKFANLYLAYNDVANPAEGFEYALDWLDLAVRGQHGIPVRGTAPGGVWASDAIAHTVRRWAPALQFTEGAAGTVRPTAFVLEQLSFIDATTVAEIVKQANRFHLNDWFVWDAKTFWYHERGLNAKHWRARIRPAQLEETGPQVDRLWESIVVQYQDVDGSTRTVGPPGSGAGVEDARLKDTDPDNPANQLGFPRRDLLVMGIATLASATELGARFLQEQKLLDTSGRAQFVGHVEDDRGVLHPYSAVRAGDVVAFVDAADHSERRIVKADHDHSAHTCSVDLDSPPEGLAALLERLGAVIVPLGVG